MTQTAILKETVSASPVLITPPALAATDGTGVLADVDLRRDFPYRYFGAQVRNGTTVFRVYCPEATEVLLLHAGNGWGQRPEYLYREPDGVWQITIKDDLHWKEYKY